MAKFLRRGYRIPPEEHARVVARLVSHHSVLPGHGPTYEETLAQRVASLLRAVDPLATIGTEVVERIAVPVEASGSWYDRGPLT